MSDDTIIERLAGDETRRDFVKKGALATLGAGVASGSAAAQEDDPDDIIDEEQFRIAMFQSDYRPDSRFIITSDVIEWSPHVPQNLGGPLTGYNTHFIVYLGTGVHAPIFISQEADLEAQFVEEEGFLVDPDQEFAEDEFVQPQVYEISPKFSRYEQTDRIITSFASPLEEDVENQIFADEGLDTAEEFNEFLF